MNYGRKKFYNILAQKNILLVHYNSVSHLHKLKKTMQGQQLAKEQAMAALPERSPTATRCQGGKTFFVLNEEANPWQAFSAYAERY
jgi:hypothetical protein